MSSGRECRFCHKKGDLGPSAVLLTCGLCKRHSHHSCLVPPVSDAHVMILLRSLTGQTNVFFGDPSVWLCPRCTTRNPEAAKQTVLGRASLTPSNTPAPKAASTPTPGPSNAAVPPRVIVIKRRVRPSVSPSPQGAVIVVDDNDEPDVMVVDRPSPKDEPMEVDEEPALQPARLPQPEARPPHPKAQSPQPTIASPPPPPTPPAIKLEPEDQPTRARRHLDKTLPARLRQHRASGTAPAIGDDWDAIFAKRQSRLAQPPRDLRPRKLRDATLRGW